jgi:hypothetical protein
MGADISAKDQRYARYAGGDLLTSSKMADIDVFIESGLIPEKFIPLIKLCRMRLDYQRIAYFVTVGSDVFSKLAFIQGEKYGWESDKDRVGRTISK